MLDEVGRSALEAKHQVIIAHKGDLVLMEMKLDESSWPLQSELVDLCNQPWQGSGAAFARVILQDPFSCDSKARNTPGCLAVVALYQPLSMTTGKGAKPPV